MKRSHTLAGLLAVLIAVPISAQIQFSGTPIGHIHPHGLLPQPPTIAFPEVDAASLLAEDAARAAQGIKGPYRYGMEQAANVDSQHEGIWSTLPNGDRVWRVDLYCPGAYSIDLVFDTYVVPEGGRVFVYNETGDVAGAFTAASHAGYHRMAVRPISGDRVTVEYDEPAGLAGQGHLHIGHVTHAYRDILGLTKGLNDSGACNNNVICPEGDPWRDQIRSVARISFSGYLCTGQLLNNCAQDDTPYFLTANHCVEAVNFNMNNAVFLFNWESPTCTPTQSAPASHTVVGADVLVHNSGSDVALLELNNSVPANYDPFFSGWDHSGVAPANATCIHHPSGDIKKISFDYQAPTNSNFSGAQCWKISHWDDGTTEGGSSGSGLWGDNGLLIGQLFGGQASCSYNYNDYFGRFSVSWPLLEQYLDPNNGCGNTLEGQPSTVGINTHIALNSLSVAPNPARDQVSVALPDGATAGAHLILRDALGRSLMDLALDGGQRLLELDLSDRPAGVYLLELTGPGQHQVARVALER
ncbi:MAG: T9SS type A sorting domain-containing protein [Flavobacteriales bacterium]|nr:T9SS type A sorting domain-containing protein [Flavobacteriales bacterium]